jgi:hypothetical protein
MADVIDKRIMKFLKSKRKSVRESVKKSFELLRKLKKQNENLFVHWYMIK